MSPIVTVILAQIPTFVSLFETIVNLFKKKKGDQAEETASTQTYRPRPLQIVAAAFLFAVLVSGAAVAATSSVTLQWDANTEADLAGYKVWQGATPGGPYTLKQTLGKITTATVTGLPDGTHYFVVTAHDTQNNQSGYSNEVFKTSDTTPPASPKNVIITITVTVP